jgi:hypothetical protein
MQCLTDVGEYSGWETTSGKVLCSPCYFALWGPKGSRAIDRGIENERPVSRRPPRGNPIWVPGPTGDLDTIPPSRRFKHGRMM